MRGILERSTLSGGRLRICLVTTGQPSTNPRLVKEADALVEAGHDVHVVGAHWADWADDSDLELLQSRRWQITMVDWRRERAPFLFYRSRIRHWATRRTGTFARLPAAAFSAALSRVGPELAREARRQSVSLFIGHNLGALPAAAIAAARQRVPVAFDAEDFHSGQFDRDDDAAAVLTRRVERHYLPRCAYVTAASPGIAEAYSALCGIRLPTTILNVFPLRDRPGRLRVLREQAPRRLYWFSQTIGPDRGLEDAVRAMSMLRPYPLELHLRGAWQPGFESRLRALAAEGGIAQERIVSHAPASPEEMVRLASEHDIGLALEPGFTANNDIAISNKLFTYVLAGVAVLGTTTRGQARMTDRLGAAAAWCAPGDAASLAAALEPWLADGALLDRARSTAWDLGNELNWDTEKQKFLAVVERTLEQSRRATTHGVKTWRAS